MEYARDAKTWLESAKRQLAVANMLFDLKDEHFHSQKLEQDEFSGCFFASLMTQLRAGERRK